MSWATLGEYVGRTFRKDRNDTKNQSYGYTKTLFSNYTHGLYVICCLIKLYFKVIFWVALAIKYDKKCLLGWKNLSYVKDWKKKKTNCISDASFCHKIAFGIIWDLTVWQKDQIWSKITFYMKIQSSQKLLKQGNNNETTMKQGYKRYASASSGSL